MTPISSYAQNREQFVLFHALQRSLTAALAARPGLIRAWLDGLPPREPEAGPGTGASKSWRTARLSVGRREELRILLGAAETAPGSVALAAWLLAAVPVRTYFEIIGTGDARAPELAEAREGQRKLLELREALFLSNYGLAKAAAKRRSRHDYGEMLGAASDGLLDAIDRYVPGPKAARFAYFAGYWIRYHLARQFQKSGSVISFPVNQHRIGRRIDRYLAGRRPAELPPSADQVCEELRLGRAAYFWQQHRPHVISLHGPEGAAAEAPAMEMLLCDPAPEPAFQAEQTEIAARLEGLLRGAAEPATRLMLAYTHGVGDLTEAAEDYLAFLEAIALRRLAGGAPDGPTATSSHGAPGAGGVVSSETRRNHHTPKIHHESFTEREADRHPGD